ANCTTPPVCGNRVVEIGEECDPAGVGCTSKCQLEQPLRCGNGVIEAGEQCDDGNRSEHDGCTETCQLEAMECSYADSCLDVGFEFVCERSGSFCDPQSKTDCDKGDTGPCVLNPDCVTECVFGTCGNRIVDPGEQCDDGRHCSHDPEDACSTHADCTAGSCIDAKVALGIPGYCSGDDLGPCDLTKNECTRNRSQSCSSDKDCYLRACMSNEDCESLCIPTSGDGCSSSCRQELPKRADKAILTLCQEEMTGRSGFGTVGARIGSGQVLLWQRTLLEPHQNPFLEQSLQGVRFLGGRGGPWWSYQWQWWDPNAFSTFSQNAWPWYWGSSFWSTSWWAGFSGWWSGWQGYYGASLSGCAPGVFPNSLGNVIAATAGCLESVAKLKVTPDRVAIMPYEPTGITSGFACREPRAQLASIAELPPLPTIALPPYDPRTLLSHLERAICAAAGYPERNFLFLCADPTNLAPPLTSLLGEGSSLAYQGELNDEVRSLLLSQALDAAYRASDETLDQYLREAFSALTVTLETATQLIRDLGRLEFTQEVCPLDGKSLCLP
ncbi:MAG: hypothetical protein AAB853_01295, partial [Patescibacteria group bacterium]